jgi:hypothetical protein
VPYISTDQRKRRSVRETAVLVDGGQGQDRTADLPLFREPTYLAVSSHNSARRTDLGTYRA